MSKEVISNLIDALIEYADESAWDDRETQQALFDLGITPEDMEHVGAMTLWEIDYRAANGRKFEVELFALNIPEAIDMFAYDYSDELNNEEIDRARLHVEPVGITPSERMLMQSRREGD